MTETLPKIVLPRTDLIEALEARRPWAQRLDRKNAADHVRAERTILDDFRRRCREATKWTYEQLQGHNYEVEVPYGQRASCPTLIETTLDRALAALKLDQRKTITVTNANENSKIYWLLTHDETAKVDVCA